MRKNITKDLFEAFKNGDNAAFEEIFQNNFDRIKSIIRKKIQSEAESEELAQIVFFKLWESHENVKTPEKFYSYLYTITKNVIVDYIADKSKERCYISNEAQFQDTSTEIESEYDAKEAQIQVWRLVNKMPTQRKRIFEMSRQEQMSNEEIVKKLGIAKKTVENHLNIVLKKLRKAISLVVMV